MRTLRRCLALAWLAAGLCLGSAPASAALAVSATRIIFTEGSRDRSIMVANLTDRPVLLQTWVDGGEGNIQSEATPLVSVPSVLIIPPEGRRALRVMYAGDPLPEDRETSFWLNLYQVPAKEEKGKGAPETAGIDLAMHLQLKIFFRPKGLAKAPTVEELSQVLTFGVQEVAGKRVLMVRNPTPYHVSFSGMAVKQGKDSYPVTQEMDMMLQPLGQRAYGLPPAVGGGRGLTLEYSIIGDTGHSETFSTPL